MQSYTHCLDSQFVKKGKMFCKAFLRVLTASRQISSIINIQHMFMLGGLDIDLILGLFTTSHY